MNKEREMTCIICPNSCSLKIVFDDKEELEVQGALCERGIEYGKNEIVNPVRNLTTTVKVVNGVLPLVSVRSDRPIPKNKMAEAVKLLQSIQLEAPIAFHQIILKDMLGKGINIISTREIKRDL